MIACAHDTITAHTTVTLATKKTEGNHRVQVLTIDGDYIRSLGTKGDAIGEFLRPRSVLATSLGVILVSDQENTRVQVPCYLFLYLLCFFPCCHCDFWSNAGAGVSYSLCVRACMYAAFENHVIVQAVAHN